MPAAVHTEEAARTKWCPFARVGVDWHYDGHTAHFPANRGNDGNPVGPCVASDCMAWQWADPPAPHPVVEDRRRGFCGLVTPPLTQA